jgi:hypothetical protein
MTLEVEQRGNLGSSRILSSTTSTSQTKDQFHKTETIQVERLDDLIEGTSKLMKLDAQGFECNIVDGMPNLLSKASRIFTEVEGHNLERSGCSRDGYMGRFETANFQLKRYRAIGLVDVPRSSRDISMVACRQGDLCE